MWPRCDSFNWYSFVSGNEKELFRCFRYQPSNWASVCRACATMFDWTHTQTHTTLGQQQAADVHARSHRRRRHMTHPFDECRCRNHSSLNIYLFIKIVILSGLVCHMHNSWTHCIHMKSKYMKINTVIEPTSNGDTQNAFRFVWFRLNGRSAEHRRTVFGILSPFQFA